MRRFLMLCFVLLLAGKNSFASATCVEFFTSNSQNENRDATEDFIAYLANLIEQQIIAEPELQRLVSGLEAGNLVNPISEEQTQVSSAALLHRNKIQEFFDTVPLNQRKILRWAKKKLIENQITKGRREVTRATTEDPHQKMEFYPVPPGTFEFGKDKVRKKITHTFEMMSTLVTQNQWLSLMGKNPAVLKGPDYPIENITWWSAVMFANKLSEMHGLKPAYNFKDLTFKGHAEYGSLNVKSGKLKINAPRGNILLTEGYRLPTDVEQDYVLRNLGRSQTRFYFGDDEEDLPKHAWYLENSNDMTHPVAELLPFVIESGKFFDLYGNVWEWGHGKYGRRRLDDHRICGGAYNCEAYKCAADHCIYEDAVERDGDIGFRLVRTLP